MDVTYCLCYCVMGSTSVIIYEEKYLSQETSSESNHKSSKMYMGKTIASQY